MDVQAQAFNYFRVSLINGRNKSSKFKDVYHMMHNAWYEDICNTNSVFLSNSARGETLLFIKSISSFEILYMCIMFEST